MIRVKAYISFRGKFKLTYIGRIAKNGVFHFRNKQLRKACLNRLRDTFSYDCPGGSLTIPNWRVGSTMREIADEDRFITCYSKVTPHKENNKYIVTYWK